MQETRHRGPLTPEEREKTLAEMFEVICAFIRQHKYSPSIDEMRDRLSWRPARNTIQTYVKILKARGKITHKGGKGSWRSIRVPGLETIDIAQGRVLQTPNPNHGESFDDHPTCPKCGLIDGNDLQGWSANITCPSCKTEYTCEKVIAYSSTRKDQDARKHGRTNAGGTGREYRVKTEHLTEDDGYHGGC